MAFKWLLKKTGHKVLFTLNGCNVSSFLIPGLGYERLLNYATLFECAAFHNNTVMLDFFFQEYGGKWLYTGSQSKSAVYLAIANGSFNSLKWLMDHDLFEGKVSTARETP